MPFKTDQMRAFCFSIDNPEVLEFLHREILFSPSLISIFVLLELIVQLPELRILRKKSLWIRQKKIFYFSVLNLLSSA